LWLGLWFCHYSSFSYFYPLSGGKVIWEEGNRGIEVQLIHLLDFTNSSEESSHYNNTTINNFLHLICCMSIHECIHFSKNYLNPKIQTIWRSSRNAFILLYNNGFFNGNWQSQCCFLVGLQKLSVFFLWWIIHVEQLINTYPLCSLGRTCWVRSANWYLHLQSNQSRNEWLWSSKQTWRRWFWLRLQSIVHIFVFIDLATYLLNYFFFLIKSAWNGQVNLFSLSKIILILKGVLSDGIQIAVKQLSAKSKQGNREFVNEIGIISALQHPNLVRLYGCCIEGKQLLLVYECMENNSLAHVLFGRPLITSP